MLLFLALLCFFVLLPPVCVGAEGLHILYVFFLTLLKIFMMNCDLLLISVSPFTCIRSSNSSLNTFINSVGVVLGFGIDST